MRRKIVRAVVLCLAATAALAIGAAPALAASGCTCHTAVPPTGGAPAAHAPLVVGVTDCTTCHKGMTVPHPDLIKPSLTVGLVRDEFSFSATGGLSIPWVPLAGVTVYPQSKAADATDWTTLNPLKPGSRIATDGAGYWRRLVGMINTPLPEGTTFRAISEGLAGPPVMMPALSGPFTPSIPTLTLTLRGLKDGVVGVNPVTAKGKAIPVELAGQKVQVRVQRWMYGSARTIKIWRRVGGATRTIGAAGDYSYRFTPKVRGQYRIRTFMDATAAYRDVTTGWWRFRVK